MCHISPVTCHQCLQQQQYTLPLPTPPLCTVGWFVETEPNKRVLYFALLAIRSSTRSHQLSQLRSQTEGTNTHRRTHKRTLQLQDWFGLGADSVKIFKSEEKSLPVSSLHVSIIWHVWVCCLQDRRQPQVVVAGMNVLSVLGPCDWLVLWPITEQHSPVMLVSRESSMWTRVLSRFREGSPKIPPSENPIRISKKPPKMSSWTGSFSRILTIFILNVLHDFQAMPCLFYAAYTLICFVLSSNF